MTRRQPRAHRSHRSASLRQRGVYALEWAIIFPVFFALLYACISYGLAFLAVSYTHLTLPTNREV